MPRFIPLRVTNYSDEDFTRTYAGSDYTISAGETLTLPVHMALNIARHLAHREYGKMVKKVKFEKSYRFNRGDWEMLFERALPDGAPSSEPKPSAAKPATPVVQAPPLEPEREPELAPEPAEQLEDEVNEGFEELEKGKEPAASKKKGGSKKGSK